jgi:hypothetical protein
MVKIINGEVLADDDPRVKAYTAAQMERAAATNRYLCCSKRVTLLCGRSFVVGLFPLGWVQQGFCNKRTTNIHHQQQQQQQQRW